MSGGVAPLIPSHYSDVSGQLHVQPLYPQYPLSRQTDPATQGHLQPSQMGTGPLAELKRPGRGADHPPHLAPRLKCRRFISVLSCHVTRKTLPFCRLTSDWVNRCGCSCARIRTPDFPSRSIVTILTTLSRLFGSFL